MKNKLIEIRELLDLLGCEDERTIISWCKQNRIPIIKMGKKKYTLRIFLELFIKEELKKFINSEYPNPDKIMNAIEQDDKTELTELMIAPATDKAKKKYKVKVNSKAAQDYMNKFKAA